LHNHMVRWPTPNRRQGNWRIAHNRTLTSRLALVLVDSIQ
jgi:hypothetical protein